MRMLMPDWKCVQLAVEVWGEDGVKGKVGFNPEQGWYVELDDSDFDEYMKNLRRKHQDVLNNFASIPWHEAKNIQGGAIQAPPGENENRLAIYLVDCDCQAAKGFKVTNSLKEVWERKAAFMFIGSTCENCGRKMMVVLIWEDVKPRGINAKPN